MVEAYGTARKARAEVENVIDEVVETIRNGVSRPDGRAGFRAREAEELGIRLRAFADTIVDAARENTRTDIDASIDAAVETIRKGVFHPGDRPAFGVGEAAELKTHLRMFADAIVDAARKNTRTGVDAPLKQVVRTIRRGLFHVYGRAGFAAISGDQLQAYLRTFEDAVLAVVEKEDAAARKPA